MIDKIKAAMPGPMFGVIVLFAILLFVWIYLLVDYPSVTTPIKEEKDG